MASLMDWIHAQEAEIEAQSVADGCGAPSERNSSGRRSDVYSRNRATEYLDARVGDVCGDLVNYRNSKADFYSIETYISLQLIILPGKKNLTLKGIFSAYDDKTEAFETEAFETEEPKNMMSFLDTVETTDAKPKGMMSFLDTVDGSDTVCNVLQNTGLQNMKLSPAMSKSSDTWTIMASQCE